MRRITPARGLAAVLVLVALALLARERIGGWPGADPDPVAGEAAIVAAFERESSDLWVEASGIVERVLPDDDEGSRHQRFILRLPSGHTLLVSHNIDLASRLETLDVGDRVAFRGEYEWNPRGGVVHWTHHDPSGRRAGGWLEHRGERYR